jgi:2-dehydro-3-deoxygluconokinase
MTRAGDTALHQIERAWAGVTPPSGRSLDLIAVGECMVELWADQPLGKAETLRRSFGGDVLNALVMAARLGDRTGFVTLVGQDAFGPSLLEAWQSEGVDTRQCRQAAANNGLYFISLRADGEREFWYCRQGSAASLLSPDDIDGAYVAGAGVLLLSGVTQAISETAQAATLHAATLARERGTVVAYDPNYRAALWSKRAPAEREGKGVGLDLARRAFDEIAPHVDVLLASAPDDVVLWGSENEALEAAARAAVGRGFAVVGLKAGGNGAYLATAPGSATSVACAHVPAFERADVRDTTGAGDAWNAGLLHGLSCGATAMESARFANRLAACKIAFRGAVPPRDEILGRLPRLESRGVGEKPT